MKNEEREKKRGRLENKKICWLCKTPDVLPSPRGKKIFCLKIVSKRHTCGFEKKGGAL